MRTLILMRHAKSDWSDSSLADHDRPLNPRGRRAAPRMAQHLSELGIHAEFILASSARRVQQTVELMQESWSSEAEVLTENDLYLASPSEIAKHVDRLHDDWQSVLVVGHNPGMSALCGSLSGGGIEMPTAAVAVFQTEASSWKHAIARANWTLHEYSKPRELE
ncbi:MAG: histidine phosphatase family protein [Planctomycetota bacterium]